MLEAVQQRVSDRKFRLFLCAVCRNRWNVMTDQHSRATVEVAEKLAAGIVDEFELDQARMAALEGTRRIDRADSRSRHEALSAVRLVEIVLEKHIAAGDWWNLEDESDGCSLLRDIFGNPFRPVTLDPRWLTPDVVEIAKAIYEDRAFDRMPILSDALMDAGCDNEDIINHCRGDGPHVRGCWVVDLILGKA